MARKKGSIYLTLIIVALVLALIFINTTQNRIKNDQKNEVDVKSDQIAYSFSEEMTAYASAALTTAADSAIYENAKKGFAKVVHECYSKKDPLVYEQALSNMLLETENRVNLKLSGSGSSELDFGSVLDVSAPDLNKHDVMQGEFDCGFSISYLVTQESGLSKDDIDTAVETELRTVPHNNAWAALLRAFTTYDLTNEVSLAICGSMGAVTYIARDGEEYFCPALSDETVDNILSDALDELNDHVDYECDDGSGNDWIQCTYTELCRYVDEMGCQQSQTGCFLPTNTPDCDNTVANGCPCTGYTDASETACNALPPDCTCDFVPTTADEITCEDAHSTNDTICEIGDHNEEPDDQYDLHCASSPTAMLADSGCDTSDLLPMINGENYTMDPVIIENTAADATCEMGTYDEGEVILVLEWKCVDTNPAHCMHVEGTDPTEDCKPLEASMIQSLYMHQQPGPTLLPPTCIVPPNTCDMGCIGACFPAGTAIDMADGTTKPIESVVPGDMVKSYDENTGEIVDALVRIIEDPIAQGLYTITFENGMELKTTSDHPLYVQNPDGTIGYATIDPRQVAINKYADYTIEVGDKVLHESLEWIEITEITYEEGTVQTYNLKYVEKHRNFFAGGFLAHNAKGAAEHESEGTSGPGPSP